ncbi:MAG TPA: hypothetical protein VM901_01505 [Bdellovibrionota bacterium]|jgi:hypothetical protein|nr:hypothetical protein [Bdellovibrionota bacterium]
MRGLRSRRGSVLIIGMVITSMIVVMAMVMFQTMVNRKREAKSTGDLIRLRHIDSAIQLGLARRDVCPTMFNGVVLPAGTTNGSVIALNRISLGATPLLRRVGTAGIGFESNLLQIKIDDTDPILAISEPDPVTGVATNMRVYPAFVQYDGMIQATGSRSKVVSEMREAFVELGTGAGNLVVYCSSRAQYTTGLMSVSCNPNQFVNQIVAGIPSCN